MSVINIFGTDSGGWYSFWSGFAQGVPIIGGVYLLARKHNCHVHRCWRVGRHPVDGTSYIVCKTHHPSPPKSAADIAAEHKAAMASMTEDQIVGTDADC